MIVDIPGYRPHEGWGNIPAACLWHVTGPMPEPVENALPSTCMALNVSEYLPHEAAELEELLPEHLPNLTTWFEQWDTHGGSKNRRLTKQGLSGASNKLETLAQWEYPAATIKELFTNPHSPFTLGNNEWAENQRPYKGRMQCFDHYCLFSYSCGSCGKFACGNSCDPSGVSAGGWGGPLGLVLVTTPQTWALERGAITGHGFEIQHAGAYGEPISPTKH